MVDYMIEEKSRDQEWPPVFEAKPNARTASVDAVIDWFDKSSPDLRTELDRKGAFIIRGFEQMTQPEDYERFARTLCTDLVNYVGGTTPRRVVSGKIVTSTEMAGTWSIPLHQEMSYTANAPDKVFFFGLTPAEKGGESVLADMRRVTTRLESLRRRYEHGGLRLRRALPPLGGEARKIGVQKTWNEVFDTSDKSVVERIASERDWDIRWLEDDFLVLTQESLPAYKRHPRTGESVWFNQMHTFSPAGMIAWAVRDNRTVDAYRLQTAMRESPDHMDTVVREDGSPLPETDIELANQALLDEAVPIVWHKADIFVLDNILTAHGRTQFEGPRRLLAALGQDS